GSLGKTYHLTDPHPHSAVEISRMFARAIGKQFAYVPVPTPLARALFSPKPVERFFGMPRQALDYFDDPVRHDATQATADLAALGIVCPRLEDYGPALVPVSRARKDEIRREAMV